MNRFSLVQWVFAFKTSQVIGTDRFIPSVMFPFQTGVYLAGGCLSLTELTTRQKWNIFVAETNYKLVSIKIKQTEKKMVNIKIDSHMGRCSVHLDTNMTKSKNSEICLSHTKWISTYTLASIKETAVSFQESCRIGSDPQQTDVLWILSERDSNILMS